VGFDGVIITLKKGTILKSGFLFPGVFSFGRKPRKISVFYVFLHIIEGSSDTSPSQMILFSLGLWRQDLPSPTGVEGYF